MAQLNAAYIQIFMDNIDKLTPLAKEYGFNNVQIAIPHVPNESSKLHLLVDRIDPTAIYIMLPGRLRTRYESMMQGLKIKIYIRNSYDESALANLFERSVLINDQSKAYLLLYDQLVKLENNPNRPPPFTRLIPP